MEENQFTSSGYFGMAIQFRWHPSRHSPLPAREHEEVKALSMLNPFEYMQIVQYSMSENIQNLSVSHLDGFQRKQ